MNKADVLSKVSEKTGIDSAICEKVIEAFEEQAGDALMEKSRGHKPTTLGPVLN